jgi:hypothetical protein
MAVVTYPRVTGVGALSSGASDTVSDYPNALRDVRALPIVDGGGAVIAAGSKGFLVMPAGELEAVRLYGDAASGSIAVDLRRTTYADFLPGTHPVAGDSIIGAGTALAIAAAAKHQETAFAGWTSTTFAEGDVVEVVVTGSPATFTRLTVELLTRRT